MKINVFTIGFAKKNAHEFFTKLKQAEVKSIIDVRLNNVSQLAGFTKKNDLQYFLRELCDLDYIHMPELAPTKEILRSYQKKEIDWDTYETLFNKLLVERHIENLIEPQKINGACFLCSEAKPDKCHRRLIAEYLKNCWRNVLIHHL